jgi:hypothetical protein
MTRVNSTDTITYYLDNQTPQAFTWYISFATKIKKVGNNQTWLCASSQWGHRMFNRALSATDIANIYQRERHLFNI